MSDNAISLSLDERLGRLRRMSLALGDTTGPRISFPDGACFIWAGGITGTGKTLDEALTSTEGAMLIEVESRRDKYVELVGEFSP